RQDRACLLLLDGVRFDDRQRSFDGHGIDLQQFALARFLGSADENCKDVVERGGMDSSPPYDCDVIIVGGGANGLVCAIVLARAGLSVQVIEDKPAIGGMHRTEYPFARAPRLGTYTGAHRLGYVPGDL